MNATWTNRTIVLITVAAILAGGCSGDDGSSDTTTTVAGGTDAAGPVVNVEGRSGDDVTPVGLRLSEGEPASVVATPISVVDGTPLTPEQIDTVLGRLPEWDVPVVDRQPFAFPPQTLLPPRVGDTIDTAFPPTDDPGTGPTVGSGGTLEVLRFQPEGPVELAPFITVTFDHPMVSLSTLDQLDTADVPVEVTPAVDGRWRWIGTRTLRFEAVADDLDRLPGSTAYTVEVPAGTRSADGARLDDDVSWTFTTPTVRVVELVGADRSLPLDPVFVAVFDQIVDPTAVLPTIELRAGGDSVPLRLANSSEVDADAAARAVVDRSLPGRTVAFRPVRDLPPDTTLVVEVGPGTPSAEGPDTTATAQTFGARTFGSLDIVRDDCGWGDGCEPGTPFSIEFSNVLDPDAFDAGRIAVEPSIPGMRIDVYGPLVTISGATLGRTDYTVTFDADLADEFGQTLGTDRTLVFEVGAARPELRGLDRQWITTDPTAESATLTVSTINHDAVAVRAWAVDPGDLDEFRRYLDRWYSDADTAVPTDWPLVFDETITVDSDVDRWIETPIDLTAVFDQTGSQLVVEVRSTLDLSRDDDEFWRNVPTIAWVQRTTLGIDAVVDGRHLVVRTTDLTTGEPLAKVPVELIGDGRIATSDAEGLAEIELGPTSVIGLWARADDQTSFLPADWWDGWVAQERSDEARWYVFDDRGVYRPGETARLTGWVRNFTWSTDLQLELWEPARTVRYSVRDAQGVELASGTSELSDLGRFTFTIDVPAGANLGAAYVEFFLDGVPAYTYGSHQFQIQEFRRPEFEVVARTESAAPYYVADPMTVAVDADYFAGGPLPDADVDWAVRSSSTTYSPPNWGDFSFGEWQPWWSYGGWSSAEFDAGPCWDCGPFDSGEAETFSGRTDASGTHYLRIDVDGPDADLPTSVVAEATVFDVNRQAWSSRVELLVHAARLYVGLRSDRSFVEAGTPIRIDAVVTDVDGSIAPGRTIEMSAGRIQWAIRSGEWTEEVVDGQTCSITSTDDVTDGSMRCEFATEVGGEYRITATVTDADGRSNRTELTQWVSGGGVRPTRSVDQGDVTIVPDAETYQPGDVARLLVVAPFAPAHGAVIVARGEIVSTFGFEAENGTAVVEVPIESTWIPNVTVQVDVTGVTERTDDDGTPRPDLPLRTAYAVGTTSLSIPPLERTLTVTATPADAAVGPGDDTSVTVQVTDVDGDPVVGADVAIVVVDEAVLSLTGYRLPDPLSVFYPEIWADLRSRYVRTGVVLARSDLVLDESVARATDSAEDQAAEEPAAEEPAADEPTGGSTTGSPIDLRTDFDPLAVYAPAETTDADGLVTVDVSLPDSLTRYRVMAVAVDGADHFGTGESTITSRLPLMVRPSAPRFANYGDAFEFPVVLQNQTDAPLEVDVVVQTANLDLTGPAGRRVTVPANDRVEVRFPATTDEVGTARYRIAAVSGAFADATAGSLPVYTPATAEAFATYGTIDGGTDGGAIAQPLEAPAGVLADFGGLEIGTSSTALQALTDAVLDLVGNDYGSTDAYSSRIMAVAALRDVLEAFDAVGLPDPSQLDVRIGTDIGRLVALQNADGGWPWFQRGRRSVAFITVQATHALVLARDAGYRVPDDTLSLALGRLTEIESLYEPSDSQDVRDTTTAYALHVRGLAGDRDAAGAQTLFERADDDLGLDAIAWLWASIDDPDTRSTIERRIRNAAVETAGAAVFAGDYTEDAWVIARSERRTDGIVLDALLTETPDSDLIPKVVAGLLGNQVRGRWNNAYENSFILLALDRYFEAFEGATPEFIARTWLGDRYVAGSEFVGRSTDRVNTLVPMTELVGGGDTTIVLSKQGDGRLYYRLGLRYAPADLTLDPRDEGFVVDRVYESVDDPGDVVRAADGSWRIRAGASVRVRVTMVADAQRTGVALIDPLPAGLEPVNPALAISPTEPPPSPSDSGWWWGWYWFEHQNLRDDRAEAFATYLPGGTYEYSYVARATTPGTFVVPPARAEEMYAPEVFGRSGSDRVVIG